MGGMKNNTVKIQNRLIGDIHSCFIIAEVGINHNGDIGIAKQLIDVAIDAGVDAVKFQTFTAEGTLNKDIIVPPHIKSKKDLYKQIQSWEFSESEFKELSEYCNRKNIIFLSTPYDTKSVKLLEHIGVTGYKNASCNINNYKLLEAIADTNKPIILSSGMSTLKEITTAIDIINNVKKENTILLYCKSTYPTDILELNLNSIKTLKRKFDIPIGYSDHTLNNEASFIAITLGAKVIEKHITLNRGMDGPDHKVSANPKELKDLVQGIRRIETMLGVSKIEPSESELVMINSMRTSVVSAMGIKKGTEISANMLTTKRPGAGIPAHNLNTVVGKIAKHDIEYDRLIKKTDLTSKIGILSVVYPESIEYLPDLLESLNHQTNKIFELYLFVHRFDFNDCNIDLEKCDFNINLIHVNKSFSIPKVREIAIKYLKDDGCEKCLFIDTDDFVAKNFVKEMSDMLDKEDIVFSNLALYHDSNNIDFDYLSDLVPSDVDYEFLIEKNCIGMNHTGLRLEIFDDNINFPDELVAGDWWLFTNLLKKGYTAKFVLNTFTYYRQYNNNVAGFNNLSINRIKQGIYTKMVHYKNLLDLDNNKFLSLYLNYKKLYDASCVAKSLGTEYYDNIFKKYKNKKYLWWEPFELLINEPSN